MRNFLVMAQWDGTAFSGWQLQPGTRTVQGTLGDAVEAMVHHPVDLHASSRTDAGVHARAMPVTFETPRTIPAIGFESGLNTHLPFDLSVLSVREIPLGWRPREHSVAKTYTYELQLGARRAITHHRTWWLKQARLDLAAMRDAAKLLCGEHDFAAFRARGCNANSTQRALHRITLPDPDADEVVSIEVIGNAFLRNMVRIIVGTLVEVGVGRRPAEWVGEVLAGRDRTRGGPTAPACGLTLTEVHFDGYPRLGKSYDGRRHGIGNSTDADMIEKAR
jgi:tRNA pseudouridine38-40 synthase